MSVQRTLDGDRAQNEQGGLRTGSAVILDQADPSTEWERVCRWVARAKAEGVLRGVSR